MTEEGIGTVFCHDDKLTFRGQKHDVGLDAEWKAVAPRTGQVTGYGRERVPVEYGSDGKRKCDFITVKEYETMPDKEKRDWFECRARAVKLPNDIVLHAEGSFIDIRMLNLWECFQTRYRASLDGLVTAVHRGVVAYGGSAEKGSREEREAMRNRFKRHWHAVSYEHDLIMPDDVGKVLIEGLRQNDMARGAYPNTVYLKGYGSKESLHVKVYSMMEKHGREGVKLEVTLRQDYLDRHGMKAPNVWEEQPDIQVKIESTLRREWRIVFDMAREARAMLAERVNVKQAELFDFMADTRNTFTEVKRRLAEVERVQAQHARDIEQLKRASGLK